MKSCIRTLIYLSLYLGISTLVTSGGFAQHDPDNVFWSDIALQREGVNGKVSAMAVYDGKLYIGGSFTAVGGKQIHTIAAWDGYGWSEVGGAMVTGHVYALHVFNGKLYIGGDFYYGSIDGNKENILAWNGSTWEWLGRVPDTVFAITSYNNEVYVAGAFKEEGFGGGLNAVAKLVVNRFYPLNRGLNGTARALAVYNGELVVGGDFENDADGNGFFMCVARWNGSSWSALGTGMHNALSTYRTVDAFAVYQNRLIAGGKFWRSGGVETNNIAAWDGAAWSALNNGMDNGMVFDLRVHNDQLIAGGAFSVAGWPHVSARNVAAWNGSAWSPLDAGLNSTVLALGEYGGLLYAGGIFHGSSVPYTLHGIASWDFSEWLGLRTGIDGPVRELAVFNDDIIAAGDFTRAGESRARWAAAWNGSMWNSLWAGGLNALPRALAVYQGDLIAGGAFVPYPYTPELVWPILGWTGATWTPVGPSWWQGANAIDYPVLDLTVYDGRLVLGGSALSPTPYIHGWDGNGLSIFGSGMNWPVHAMTTFDGDLIAGGSFWIAGGQEAAFIAAWNGNAWSALGSGMNSYVEAVTVYQGRLIAGGSFTEADGAPAGRIAAWDGSDWIPLGSGLNGFVLALAVYRGHLIAGGAFDSAGNVAVNHIAAWDGSGWTRLGGGTDDRVLTLVTHDTSLYVGGEFKEVGDGRTYAYIARWDKWTGAESACCDGKVGDVNGDGANEPTLGDVALLIDVLYISLDVGILTCRPEADIDQSGGNDPRNEDISLGDVAILIDYLFITGASLGLPGCL